MSQQYIVYHTDNGKAEHAPDAIAGANKLDVTVGHHRILGGQGWPMRWLKI